LRQISSRYRQYSVGRSNIKRNNGNNHSVNDNIGGFCCDTPAIRIHGSRLRDKAELLSDAIERSANAIATAGFSEE